MNKADKIELVDLIDEVVAKRVDEVVTRRIAESESRILEDMKQFTTVTVSQQTSDIRGDITDIRADITEMRGDISEMRGDISRLEQKVDDIAAGIGQAIDDSNEVTDQQIKDHGVRIARLENAA